MAPKKKSDTPEEKLAAKKETPVTAVAKESSDVKAPEIAVPKRMVLKTLKRVAAAPPPSPTLHRVSGVMTRRVLPKAPPPKPVPPPSPPPPPPPPAPKVVEKPPVVAPPVQAKPATVAPVAKATVVAPIAAPTIAPKDLKKPIDVKKEPAKSEPTATYKMPAPAPLRVAQPIDLQALAN